MIINEFFGDQYTSIYADSPKIDAFINESQVEYTKPLEDIFIHDTKNEMFLVLNCLNIDYIHIKELCKEWEYKILNFVNIGTELRDHIKYLKYEITLLILCTDNKTNTDDNYRSETEKSLNICRKVFILCDKDGSVLENNWPIIPFYFSSIVQNNNGRITELERDLQHLIPENEKIASICDSEELTSDDKEYLIGWLLKNENN